MLSVVIRRFFHHERPLFAETAKEFGGSHSTAVELRPSVPHEGEQIFAGNINVLKCVKLEQHGVTRKSCGCSPPTFLYFDDPGSRKSTHQLKDDLTLPFVNADPQHVSRSPAIFANMEFHCPADKCGWIASS